MKGQKKTTTFRKTTACPSSTTLLYFRTQKLSGEISTLVNYHLQVCDFCRAELMLLAHHRLSRSEQKVPEIPMNLRILAESILNRA
jgi:hypothetical protein